MSETRKIAAILVADVVGYSRLVGADEDRTLARLRALRSDMIDPTIAVHRGRVVKRTGDGAIVEFRSVIDAVRCALEMQSGMVERNTGVPPERRIEFRIGIHLGDIVEESDGDLMGDGVNVAARLEGICQPGGVCLSEDAYRQVRDKIKEDFVDLGEQPLKNIARSVRAYHMTLEANPPKATIARYEMPSAGLVLPDKPSIAVLPFQNLSGDPEQDYFADGITEDIITELSRFRSLFVVARNSSFQYRDKAVDVRRVARELGVHYVVEGSVRKMADRVRITAQLIDAVTGNHLWSERYDRNIQALFEVQDEVTRTIVATLVGRLEDSEIGNAMRKRTDSPAAYDNLLRGIHLLRGHSDEDNRRARELFEKAVGIDPQFALAHAYLALALLVEHDYDNAPDAITKQALDRGLAGVKLDPRDGRCHQFLAQAYRFRGEFDQALSHFERSVALNPNDANAIAQMGYALAITGRADEGVDLVRQAMQLNPFHPDWYWADLAIALYAARRYEEALDAHRRVGSRAYWHSARVAACHAQLGQFAEAYLHAAEVLRLKPDFHLSDERLRYKNPADAEHVFEGLRKAGLPE